MELGCYLAETGYRGHVMLEQISISQSRAFRRQCKSKSGAIAAIRPTAWTARSAIPANTFASQRTQRDS